MSRIRTEPVLIGTVLVPVIVWLGARYGLDIDESTATNIAGVVLLAGGWIARNLVRTKATLPDPDAEVAATSKRKRGLPPA